MDEVKSIREIREKIQAACEDELSEIIDVYGTDQRSGVQKLVESARKRLAALIKERERIEKLRVYEEQYGG